MNDDRFDLARWTRADFEAECRRAYSRYEKAKTEHYVAYFAGRDERDPSHRLLARDLKAALPAGWACLGERLPKQERHRWHLSGKSSQVLALGLLGVATERDPTLGWFFDALDLPRPARTDLDVGFEHGLPPALLNERPRVTAIDFLVADSGGVVCVEAKWTERGMGGCSCNRGKGVDRGDPGPGGHCSPRVLARPLYDEAARDLLGLPVRESSAPCPLSFAYQVVRNVAAAVALAGADRRPVFALLYDRDNPYFGGTGRWPGWPQVLTHTLSRSPTQLIFRSCSWQDLVKRLPLDEATVVWAREKHGLDSLD